MKFSRIEVISRKPQILHFHQVFSRNFIQKLLNEIEAMRFGEMTTVEPRDSTVRRANGSWIAHRETREFARLFSTLQRLQSVFDLTKSEPFQVISYDRGGHYAPHYDFPTDEKTKKLMESRGNRIATMVIVLKRAEKGGGLIFTEIGTSLLPFVGDVILWLNMTPRNELEILSRHAACPVEEGNKIEMGKFRAKPNSTFVFLAVLCPIDLKFCLQINRSKDGQENEGGIRFWSESFDFSDLSVDSFKRTRVTAQISGL